MSLIRMHKVHEDPDTIIFTKMAISQNGTLPFTDFRGFKVAGVTDKGNIEQKGKSVKL